MSSDSISDFDCYHISVGYIERQTISIKVNTINYTHGVVGGTVDQAFDTDADAEQIRLCRRVAS